MAESFEKKLSAAAAEGGMPRRGNIVEQMHEVALSGESFEDAVQALSEVEALQNFRKALTGKPFGSFYDIFEDITNINKSLIPETEKEEKVRDLIETAEGLAGRFSPRVADLYLAILTKIGGAGYEPKFEKTKEKMADLEEKGDLQGLISGAASWDLKLNFIEQRLQGYLAGARALDRREGREMDDDVRKWREEQLKKAPSTPPERRNESKPSMDEMERLKEGERAPAIWSIHPGFDGSKYFKEQSFSKWDNSRNAWVEEKYEYQDAEFSPLCENEDFKKGVMNLVMRAEVWGGRWTSLPVPYTHGIYKAKAGEAECYVKQDQNGDLVIMAEGGGKVEIEVILSPKKDKVYGPMDAAKIKAPKMPAKFSEETEAEIERVKNSKRGNLIRARALSAYTRRRLEYSNESKYNSIYDGHSEGYFAAIDEHKKADCDVANTYFAALCSKLNIPVRHCVGHSVKGRDIGGSSSITSGTGHGWSEVWDEREGRWVRVDATPAGDRNLEEEDENEKPEHRDFIPGDQNDEEAIRPSDEKLEELRQKLEEKKEKLSYTKEERQLAEKTGVELKEARQIIKEINEAEKTRLPNGELIVDVLSRLFNAIVESRKVLTEEYDGPVKRSEGGETIQDIVRHKIGIAAGESDPRSREKPATEEKQEKTIGGFDLYIIGDKSGSMGSSVEGEALWRMQRRAEYLIFSSLHRFGQAIKRAGISKKEALSVRTQGISFRGSGPEDIDLDKPLHGDFTAEDKVILWRSLGNQGYSNGDVAALSYILEQIKLEIAETEKKTGKKDNRLRLIMACSDGGPDDPAAVRELAEELGKLGAVVVGIGLTETAAAVPIIYNTPYSRGDIARDINDLPAVVAKHLIMEAIKLFPERARDSVKGIIENTILKFKN